MTYDHDADIRGQRVRVEVWMNIHEARYRPLSTVRRDGHLQRNTKIKILPKKKNNGFSTGKLRVGTLHVHLYIMV